MFLTPDDLRDLTGYRLATRQAAWLRERGWRFELDRGGDPGTHKDPSTMHRVYRRRNVVKVKPLA